MSDEAPVKTVIRRQSLLVFLGWTVIALVAPLMPRMLVDPQGVLAIAPEVALAMVCVWGVGFVDGTKGLQTVLAVLSGLGGAVLVTFEGIRAIGRATTGEDLLLYDAMMRARTGMGELQDEWGTAGMVLGLGGGALLVALSYAGGMALAARWLHEVRWQGPWRSMGLLALVAAAFFFVFPDSRPVIPALRDNVVASLDEWNRMEEAIDPGSRFGPKDRELAHPPDVRLAVVRGHTEALRLGPRRYEVAALLRSVGGRLQDAGWSVVTGRTRPPGDGPRGLSEVSLITGIEIPRTPHLAQLMFQASLLDSLPQFLDRHGYATALLEPEDVHPALRVFGFRYVAGPRDNLPLTAGARLVDADDLVRQLDRPSFVWVRPGHQLPEDPVEGLRAELEALFSPIAAGPDQQVMWLWVGAPATGDDPEQAWPLVHVIGSNPQMVERWVKEAGLQRGMTPGRTALPHESLGEHLATILQAEYACGRSCYGRRAQVGP